MVLHSNFRLYSLILILHLNIAADFCWLLFNTKDKAVTMYVCMSLKHSKIVYIKI